jgi:cytochrome P450
MHEALKTTSKYTIARIFAPTWVWRLPVKKYSYSVICCRLYVYSLLPYRLQHVDTAFKTLKAFMDKQIAARKAELGGYSNEDSMPNDVFSRLVIANSAEKSEISLTDNEVIGNTFAQLLAGHGA